MLKYKLWNGKLFGIVFLFDDPVTNTIMPNSSQKKRKYTTNLAYRLIYHIVEYCTLTALSLLKLLISRSVEK